jgi:pyruvate/2-oxoacid:ferredoxin oxidoreductase beta subunit
VEIIAPCKTFEFKTPLTFFKDRLIDINSTLRHNPHNKTQALSFAAKAFEYDEHKNASIPIGVFWENKTNMTFESQVKEIKDNSKRKSVKQILEKFRIE